MLFAPEGGPASYAGARVVGLKGFKFVLYPELTLVPPLFGIHKHMQEFEPELIYLVNPASLGLGGIREAYRLDIPLVASYHTDVPGFAARMGMAYTQRSLWTFFRQVYNQADLVFVPSQYTKSQIEAHGFERVKVWSHGVDAETFRPEKCSSQWRRRLMGDEEGDQLVLYVGRLAAEKRIDWLLPVLESQPGARLAIVGDGPARESLEKRFKGSQTVFTGYLHGEDLAAAYASADVFAFPGANETFGNVVIEAMSSGLPVVVPDCGGVLDFVENGVSGFLFEAEDQKAFMHAVARLLANPEEATAMGKVGRAKAETMRWEAVNAIAMQDFVGLVSGEIPRRQRRRIWQVV
jgi:glycosyltransferase involved in cell wall biosynthesis